MVQNKKRGPGRPRIFDEEAVLDRAVRVFWEKGYEGASIDDLTEAMGLSRPSVYNAFGDKEALFMRCLERYGATTGELIMGAIALATDARGAVAAYLRQAATNATGEDTPHGCLLATVAPSVCLPGVREFLAASMAASETALAARLSAGVASGELPSDFPVIQRARRITDLSMSLAVRARTGATREELLLDAADAAAMAMVAS